MLAKLFMVIFAASGSGAVASKAFVCIAGYLNVLKGELPSRALTWDHIQCSTFTNQFIILRGRHFA